MIIRKTRGTIERKPTKKIQSVRREFGDFDIAVKDPKGNLHVHFYILDAHEHFDPMTSTKGRHLMYGPAAIICADNCGGTQTTEYHVNDPYVWNYLGRLIREGYANADSLISPSDERKMSATAGAPVAAAS